MSADDDDALAARLIAVRQRIAAAARASGRAEDDVTLIVVTKFQPVDVLRRLAGLGVRDFGESRWPEVRDKALELPDVRWHFVGQVQTNKARPVARSVAAIHSVDRAELVAALAGGVARPRVLVQVDLDPEPTGAGGRPSRGGASAAEVPALVDQVLAAGLDLAGVMTVPPLGTAPESAFALIREISDRVVEQAPEARWISAGMSADYEAAIRAGATHVRVGTAIVGPRPVPH